MLLALLGLAFLSAPAAAARSNRQALVIGNERYVGSPLKNPVNDARKMEEALGAAGFAVTPLYNADLRSLTQTVNAFVDGLQPEDVALVFYSGHGVQIDGENFLVPIGFVAHDEADVPFEAYSVQRIQAKIEARRVALTILILDACRDNPYRGFKSLSKGLAAMNAGRGTFIAFATRPGGTAADNPEANNSVFTSSLIEAVRQPGLQLDEVFNRVRERVDEASGHRQLPWTSSSVIGSFFFHPQVAYASSQVNLSSPSRAEPSKMGDLRKGWADLGVEIVSFSPEYGREHGFPMLEGGVVVKEILRNGPAALAGIQKGDVIRRIDGVTVSVKSFSIFLNGNRDPRLHLLEIWRGSERLNLAATPVDVIQLYQQACDSGDGYACYRAGLIYKSGKTLWEDFPLSVFFFEKGCKLGDLLSCTMVGYAFDTGTGVYQNYQKAAALYKQACDGHEMQGCGLLGVLYRNGTGVAKDSLLAAKFLQKACDGDYLSACNLIGTFYENGVGVSKDQRRAADAYRHACAGGNMIACTNLGVLYGSGDGVEKNASEERVLYERACRGGDMTGCDNLGRIMSQDPGSDLKKVVELFELACRGGHQLGCFDLGEQIESGEGIAKNPARAAALFRKACDVGIQEACDKLKAKPLAGH